jgi:hypothetical protein
MLVYQKDDKLILLNAIPVSWLEDGKQILVQNQSTEYGNISYHVISNINKGFIEMTLEKPEYPVPGGINIRLRHPRGVIIKSVQINGNTWNDFNAEYILLTNFSEKIARIKIQF